MRATRINPMVPVLLLTLAGCRNVAGGAGGEVRSWRPVLDAAGVTDARVVRAFDVVSRAEFLEPSVRADAWEDAPLPIGHGQTTSQPSLIAQMLEAAGPRPGCRALEVGSGCGYQTALLAVLCDEVYGIDIVEPLATRAAQTLERLGVKNAHVKAGDGYQGWPEHAPFDVIIVAAGAAKVPRPLLEQLAFGGRLVIPVGPQDDLDLKVVTKAADGRLVEEVLLPVRFVPLVGPAAEEDRRAR